MKVEVVSKKLVKPWSPTPRHLKWYKISLLDELITPENIGLPLLYESKPQRISDLEESLSKTLVHFYPLAGRYVAKDCAVNCSDEGVEFVVAEAPDVDLKDLIAERNVGIVNQTFLPPLPLNQFHNHVGNQPLPPFASFQFTELRCGGAVLGISMSHKLVDGCSIGTFLRVWAINANRPPGAAAAACPNFYSPALFPCSNDDQLTRWADVEYQDPDLVAKRFEFKKEAIDKLRSKLMSSGGGRPISRVRVVTALISTALIRADTAKYGKCRSCVIAQPVNMRERTIPPLPEHSFGNLALVSSTPCIATHDDGGIGLLQRLVDAIGDALEKSVADCAEMFLPGDGDRRNQIIKGPLDYFMGKLMGGEVNVMWFSDLRKFGYHEADLGWGKPARVSIALLATEKMTLFLGNQEGGRVDAIVHLKHHDMAAFEQDQNIKSFATCFWETKRAVELTRSRI